MIIFAVAAAVVVAVLVVLLGPDDETASQQAASVEPVSSGAERDKRKFDPGEKLEIYDEPAEEEPAKPAELEKTPRPRQEEREAQKKTLPVAPQGWPAPSTQEVAAA